MAKKPTHKAKAKEETYKQHMIAQRRFSCREKSGISNHDGSCLKCDAAAGQACKQPAP